MKIIVFVVAIAAVGVMAWYRNKRNELMFLRAVNVLGSRAYGFNVAHFAGISIVGVYLIGNRLEQRGLVRSEFIPGGFERGHKNKKLWLITDAGLKASQ